MSSTDSTPQIEVGSLFQGLPKSVEVYEVGPRDGLQNEPNLLPVETKKAMIEGLVDAGVKRIEITSFVNPRWIPALADHKELAKAVVRKEGVRYTALVPNMRGLDGASEAGMDEVAIFMSATETHNQKNINKSRAQAIEVYKEVVDKALERGMKVRGYVSCVYGCPYEGHVPVENTVEVSKALLGMGIYELSLGDTIGVGNPLQTAQVLAGLRDAGQPLEKMAVHFHDTRGTALANIMVSLQMGIRVVDSSIGGLGGCPYAPGASGNVSTEDVVYMLQGMGVETGIDLDGIVPVSAQLEAELGRELPSKYLKAHAGFAAKKSGAR